MFQADSTKKLDSREQELSDCKLLIQQHEARIKSVQEAMKELEAKKCMLEMKLDEQNEEVSKLIAKGKATIKQTERNKDKNGKFS